MAKSTKTDMYAEVTSRIVAALESGTIPWRKPWSGHSAIPTNLATGKKYRGVNVWVLGSLGYDLPYFCTFKQAKSLGGQVRKGEKGYPVVFWKFLKKEEGGKTKSIPLLRHYTVFNIAQIDGVEAPQVPETTHNPISACETVVKDWIRGPRIEHNAGDRACYSPQFDRVTMPNPEQFQSPSAYYSTLFHELTHSTGHKDRLNRETLNNIAYFGSHEYSKEELVAELGASYLCAHTGIDNDTIDNSASYIASWLKALKNDPKLLLQAASQAQKAADHILGTEFKKAD